MHSGKALLRNMRALWNEGEAQQLLACVQRLQQGRQRRSVDHQAPGA